MWTHRDVAALLRAAQTANLIQQEEVVEPRPGVDALLDRWERVVDALHRGPRGRTDGTAPGVYARAR